MGALAPNPPWIPEDDLVLKNAIEAGASLESLAKGAARFSRRFSVQELRERWHSILYDPVVSGEASIGMTEFEQCASTLPSKSNRFGNCKDNKIVPAKRKSEGIRELYYTTRKRICNEPFDPMDLSFLIAPSNNNFVGDGGEPLPVNCMIEDPITNPFGLGESTLEIMHHDFPEILTDDGTVIRDAAAAAHIFHSEIPNPVEGNFHIETHNVHKEVPHVIGAGVSIPGSSGLEELGQPNDLPMHSLFEADGLGVKPASTFDSYRSKFGEKRDIGSPIKGCDASFHNLEMPIWKPGLPVDVSHTEKDLQTGNVFALPDDVDVMDMSKSGDLDGQKPCNELKSPDASTEGYLAVLSNSLMDFTNDDELLMEDGKDMIGKFFKDSLGSILSNAPADVNQDHHMPSISEPQPSLGLDTYLVNPPSTCLTKLCSNSEPQMLSQFPELYGGIICCTLNTEDMEIPCNDDVIFHKQVPSSAVSHAAQQSIGNPGYRENGEIASNLMHREHKPLGHALPKPSNNQPAGDCGVKFELPKNDSKHMGSGRVGIASGSPRQINSINDNKDAFMAATTNEETVKLKPAKHHGYNTNDCLTEKPSHGSVGFKSFPLEQEPSRIENHRVSVEDFVPSEKVANTSTSNQEDLAVESDGDLPYFSDVEAMILERDLDPDDPHLYSSEEVSKYQHGDTRKAIIRMEQSFHACIKRDIAFHGAFAVLIGRQTKHYIRKPEVLLGRATQDVIVDIDLGREARGNKISRRQAIIKMDKRGSFFLKNLGKFPISVNDKEIRGMPFMFEVNQANVKRFVDKMDGNGRRRLS